MATMKPTLRHFELSSIVVLFAGVLCGIGIMTAVSLVHPLKQQAAETIVVQVPATNSAGIAGGRLGGITSADTPNDAAIRNELSAPAAAGADFYLPGDVDGGTLIAGITRPNAATVGGRLGGLTSADAANDAAVKQGVAPGYSDQAGQRDVNAADQTAQPDSYPIFKPGQAW